jgi:hypothetical protein
VWGLIEAREELTVAVLKGQGRKTRMATPSYSIVAVFVARLVCEMRKFKFKADNQTTLLLVRHGQ